MEIARDQVVAMHREWMRWFVDEPGEGSLERRLSVWFILSLAGLEHPIEEGTGYPSLSCRWCDGDGNPDLWR